MGRGSYYITVFIIMRSVLIVLTLVTAVKCGEFTLYEGNDGSQNQVCTLYWDQDATFNFQHYDACENDETRSGILRDAEFGTIITLYDSPSGDKGDDYTEIKVKALVAENVMIRSYEESQTIPVGDGVVEITHHHHNGLDGKVSRVEILVLGSRNI